MNVILTLWFFCIFGKIFYWCRSAQVLKDKSVLPGISADLPAVSIVVVAKNEAENLERNLPFLIDQDYEDCEIIVVDDHSKDNTKAILEKFADGEKFKKRVQYLSLKEGETGKKQGLIRGIASASGNWLALTDADCRPASRLWLKKAMSHHHSNDVVLGYGAYAARKGWLNKFIRFETWFVGSTYLTFAANGVPYMGVGRNLFYSMATFDESDKMTTHLDLLSGDDDLFISSLPDKTRFEVSLDPDSFTISEPKKSLLAFFQQKQRHISTSIRYKPKTRLWLTVLHASHIGSYILALAMLFYSVTLGAICLFSTFALSHVSYKPILNRFGHKDLVLFAAVLDFFLVFFYLLLSVFIFSKPKKWIQNDLH